MKISIKTNHFTPPETNPEAKSDLRGYATVRIDDKYIINKVQIRERRDNNELFVSLPSYEAKEGKGRIEAIHPITREERAAFNKAVLKQFNDPEMENSFYAYNVEKQDFIPQASAQNFNSFEKNGMLGYGTIKFGNWVANNVVVRMSNEGKEYISTPSYDTGKVDEKGRPQYEGYFHPITTEAWAEMAECAITALKQAKAERIAAADYGTPVKEEFKGKDEPAVENEQSVDNSILFDESEFEDLPLNTASNSRGR